MSDIRAPANFDRVARIYRWCEYLVLGPLLARTRSHLLSKVTHARRAWVFGDGDGRFLKLLLHAAPRLQAVAVDSSAAMLRLLERRCVHHAERLQTYHGDALAFTTAPVDDIRGLGSPGEPGSKPDLVVTHFFLDCLTSVQIGALLQAVKTNLAPEALWLVSDFAIPAQQPWRWLGSALIRGLYLAFGLLTGLRVRSLPSTQAAFVGAGFRCIHHVSWIKGLLYSQVWQLSARPDDAVETFIAQLPGSPSPSTSM